MNKCKQFLGFQQRKKNSKANRNANSFLFILSIYKFNKQPAFSLIFPRFAMPEKIFSFFLIYVLTYRLYYDTMIVSKREQKTTAKLKNERLNQSFSKVLKPNDVKNVEKCIIVLSELFLSVFLSFSVRTVKTHDNNNISFINSFHNHN